MELEPTFLMRQIAMVRAQTSPRRWLLPYLRGNGFSSFVALFFVRWVVVILWTIPALLIGALLFLVSLPIFLICFIFILSFDAIVQRDWPLRESLFNVAESLLFVWLKKALFLELWLEKHL